VIRNVDCSVSPERGDLLLGESFLMRLPPWSIDYQRRALLIGESPALPSTPIVHETPVVREAVVPAPASPMASQSPPVDPNDLDHACAAAQAFCRDRMYMCGVYQQEFKQTGRICAGVSERLPPAPHYDDEDDSDYACSAAKNFCRDGMHMCDVYRREFRASGRVCHGVTDSR
jgi:hypothetical protein